MDFLKDIDRNNLLIIIHEAIDRIINNKNETKKSSVSSEELDSLSSIFIQYCTTIQSESLNKSEMLDYFPLNQDKKECVFKAIETRKSQVCKHLVNEHNCTNIPLVKSFDWDLKFIIGNSSLAAHREELATLSLNCQKSNKSETISVELDEHKLDLMIKNLEDCIGAE